MNAEKMIINRPPSLTWYSLGLNGAHLQQIGDPTGALMGIDCPEGVTVRPVSGNGSESGPTAAGESFAAGVKGGIELAFQESWLLR